MQLNSDKISFVLPGRPDFESIRRSLPRIPFDDKVCKFLSKVSKILLKDVNAKAYTDVVTFAFWCRKSNLEVLKNAYADDFSIGRGVIFHIAPANVPVNFAYSLVSGLLTGNVNIVRVPTKEYPQVDIISKAFGKALENEEFCELAPMVTLLRYEKDDKINEYLSSLCDVRIIWGGDNTVSEIRRAPLNPRSFDITFADRYSLCVIKANEYLNAENPLKIAQDFYNDTYLFDQNACTAPHLVVWLGENSDIEAAKDRYWKELHKIVIKNYNIQPVQVVDKLMAFLKLAVNLNARKVEMPDNLIMRVSIDRLPEDIEAYRCQGGFFIEYGTKKLEDIVPAVNRKYQTLCCYGFDINDLKRFVIDCRLTGIDRIVKIGQTMDFSLNWDGYDLCRVLTRRIGE